MSSHFEPPDKDQLKKEYERRLPQYTQLTTEVRYILERALKETNIPLSDVTSRPKGAKDFESFYGKIVRKEISGDPFEAIEDIAGLRVICLYRSGISETAQLVKKEFKVIREETSSSSSQLGYRRDHYIVQIPESYAGPRYDGIKNLNCEIQIRTVSAHAWATISHHLDYKQEVDIP